MSRFKGFSSVQLTRPKRSDFDLSHTKRLTTRMGRLTPILCQEAVPSDKFSYTPEMLIRMAPLLSPIYDEIMAFVHVFFVPNRLLWEEWEEFITGGREGDIQNAPVPPHINIGTVLSEWASFPESSLPDYLGVPVFDQLGLSDYTEATLDVMPFAAYQQIYMDYYRDRNFVGDDFLNDLIPMKSGLFNDLDFDSYLQPLRVRSYLKEYFTSALPFTQRGQEVMMPLAGTGSVEYFGTSQVLMNNGDAPVGVDALTAVGATMTVENQGPARIENIETVNIENSAVSINDFRTAYAMQVWMERNAVAGSRYVESTQAHFGVKPQDSRLQRAEFLGGIKINMRISEVVSTAWSSAGEDTYPLGNMAGHGVTYGSGKSISYFCPEHGFIMAIMSIMSPPSYHQGLPRMFKRRSFLDYPWPTFAKLGEQEVHKYELFASGPNLTPDEDGNYPLFGYQSRYADWKYVQNSSHGMFHSSLMFWTLVRNFTSSPTLSRQFLEYDVAAQTRIFAVQTSNLDNFWILCRNKLSVRRPLPYYGVPNTLGF